MAVGKIEEGDQVDVIYTDISKAYDSFSHSELVGKICRIGVKSNLVAWIQSYLSDRK